ncbi:MAG: enolase C-terminal domain-like protein [Dehalococcoidia bacterium]
MKITNIETIVFKTTTRDHMSRWWIPVVGDEVATNKTLTKISTDEGAEGYMFGGDPLITEKVIKPLLIGENPLDREKLWHWMDQLATTTPLIHESHIGVVDCALWDLVGRMADLPVHKLLGGCRNKVKAYGSSHLNMGDPRFYAEHVQLCKEQGYKAYKVHPLINWDPVNWEPGPQLPGSPKEDVEICKAVREAAGEDMVLMSDPHGVYTLEQAIWVGKELEQLNFYWMEHPMSETRMEAYRRLTRELDLSIVAPERVTGSIFTRAEWVVQGASDILRIGIEDGGITACMKMVNVCEAFGIQCEIHLSHLGAAPTLQVLGASPEATCEYFERGLLHPDLDYETPPPHLKSLSDPMDDEGNVLIPQGPGLGMDINWDYINENRVPAGE